MNSSRQTSAPGDTAVGFLFPLDEVPRANGTAQPNRRTLDDEASEMTEAAQESGAQPAQEIRLRNTARSSNATPAKRRRPKEVIILGDAPDTRAEHEAHEAGYRCVCGIDEAGRGPLAGPVVAAAVVLPDGFELPGLNDSKKLTARKREALFEALMQDDRILKSVAQASVEEIDRLNILHATHLAMRRAAEGLPKAADFCLIDGLAVPNFPLPSRNLIKGDARCLSIAAASILAKVTRDRLMTELDRRYPQYGFAKHAGYGTAAHLQALREYGITPHHRRSFAPVAQMALPLSF